MIDDNDGGGGGDDDDDEDDDDDDDDDDNINDKILCEPIYVCMFKERVKHRRRLFWFRVKRRVLSQAVNVRDKTTLLVIYSDSHVIRKKKNMYFKWCDVTTQS
ncbi:hypothetical protein HZH66_010961 [Vespula vulgaris]|uniref:Uncharacterized protein n=1 Tax=Vespula vulgaris TaxID=7454 RepID=A0A834JH27_VESVU|nr:hypothetical protein HZH66_010961 [Vespula vulgaris]